MRRIVLASNNPHKVGELKAMLEPLGYEVLSLGEAGLSVEVEEDQDSFEGNARKKAVEILAHLPEALRKDAYVLADDTGLSVDILDGAPGVYSARYAGEGLGDAANNEKLLEELKGTLPMERTARFITALVLLGADMDLTVFGEAEGVILTAQSGEGGFGYDGLFHSKDLGKSFAAAAPEEKNRVSHRGRALQKLVEELRDRESGHRGGHPSA